MRTSNVSHSRMNIGHILIVEPEKLSRFSQLWRRVHLDRALMVFGAFNAPILYKLTHTYTNLLAQSWILLICSACDTEETSIEIPFDLECFCICVAIRRANRFNVERYCFKLKHSFYIPLTSLYSPRVGPRLLNASIAHSNAIESTIDPCKTFDISRTIHKFNYKIS